MAGYRQQQTAGFPPLVKVALALGGANYLAAPQALTTGTPVNIQNYRNLGPTALFLVVGTALFTSTSGALDPCDLVLGNTSASIAGAYVSGSTSSAQLAGGATFQQVTIWTLQTIATSSRIFLVANGTTNATVQSASAVGASPNASGIIALNLSTTTTL